MTKLMIGADPELFLFQGNKFLSAHDQIPGTKSDPFPVEKGAIQHDGTAAEFNISPALSLEEFKININTVLSELRRFIPKDTEIRNLSSYSIPRDVFKRLPLEALELGCDPDYNAYTLSMNTPLDMDELGENDNLRTTGGHIHVGWRDDGPMDEDHFLMCAHFTKILDFFLGIPSCYLDQDNKRKNLYGGSGSFRPKKYGVEYRVLSSFWVLDEKLIDWVYNGCLQAWDFMQSNIFDEQMERSTKYIMLGGPYLNEEILVESIRTCRLGKYIGKVPSWQIVKGL